MCYVWRSEIDACVFFLSSPVDLELTDLGESSSGFLLFSAKIINQLLKMPEFLCGCREPKL